MKRRYEVEVLTTVVVEVDDQVTSEHYEGETILTAHENRERFVEGSTLETAIASIAVSCGIQGRSMGNVDGWADFPREAAWADATYYETYSVVEVTPEKTELVTHDGTVVAEVEG